MNFNDWKEKYAHLHISDEMKKWLKQLEEMEQAAARKWNIDHIRLRELREFAEKVEKLLRAEWKHFLECLEGNGGDYN